MPTRSVYSFPLHVATSRWGCVTISLTQMSVCVSGLYVCYSCLWRNILSRKQFNVFSSIDKAPALQKQWTVWDDFISESPQLDNVLLNKGQSFSCFPASTKTLHYVSHVNTESRQKSTLTHFRTYSISEFIHTTAARARKHHPCNPAEHTRLYNMFEWGTRNLKLNS
jgi:hypothetical protein